METTLSQEQRTLHELAINLSKRHRKLEGEIIETLLRVERSGLYRKLGHSSLFSYTTVALGFTESVAYAFIVVARKSKEIPKLKSAVLNSEISVFKAQRIVSSLTSQNVDRWLEFSKTRSCKEIDREVARLNPKQVQKARVKFLGNQMLELKICLSEEVHQKIRRAQDLESQRTQAAASLEETINAVFEAYLKAHDPVLKAQRVLAKKEQKAPESKSTKERVDIAKSELWTSTVVSEKSGDAPSLAREVSASNSKVPYQKRVPLTAEEKHIVFQRDGGRCTYINEQGIRCCNERWLQIHHIRPVSYGGSNDPKNLTTLCWSCHDLCHQLPLPIEGGRSQLRSPSRTYGLLAI